MPSPTQTSAEQIDFTAATAEFQQALAQAAVQGNVRDVMEFVYGLTKTYPVISGEVGVTNVRFCYGDLRRYGVLGGQVAGEQAKIQNAINSARRTSEGGAGFGHVFAPRFSEDIIQTGHWVLQSGVHIYGIGRPTFRNVSTASQSTQRVWLAGNYGPALFNATGPNAPTAALDLADANTWIKDKYTLKVGGIQDISLPPVGPPRHTYTAGMTIVMFSRATSGDLEPAFLRFNKVIEVSAPDILGMVTLTLMWELDQGPIALTNRYAALYVAPASGWGNSHDNLPARCTEGSGIHNIKAVSEQFKVMQYGGTLNCSFDDLEIEGTGIWSGNTFQRTQISKVRGSFYNEAIEMALGCYKSSILDLHASFLGDAKFVAASADAISIDGGAKDCIIADMTIKYGDVRSGATDAGGSFVAMGATQNCILRDVNIEVGIGFSQATAVNVRQRGNTGEAGSTGYGNSKNRISNLMFKTSTMIGSYVRNENPLTNPVPDNFAYVNDFLFEDCRFFGPVNNAINAGGAVLYDYPGMIFKGCFFEQGDFKFNAGFDQSTFGDLNIVEDCELKGGIFRLGNDLSGSAVHDPAIYRKANIRRATIPGTRELRRACFQLSNQVQVSQQVANAPTLYQRNFAANLVKDGDEFRFRLNYGHATAGNAVHFQIVGTLNPDGLLPTPVVLADITHTATGRFAGEFILKARRRGTSAVGFTCNGMLAGTGNSVADVIANYTDLAWEGNALRLEVKAYVGTSGQVLTVDQLQVDAFRIGMD